MYIALQTLSQVNPWHDSLSHTGTVSNPALLQGPRQPVY